MSDYNTNGNSYHKQPLICDSALIRQHLYTLGYRDGEKVHYRALHRSNDPKKAKKFEYTLPETPKSQDPEYSFYFVVNPGGQTATQIKEFRCLFCDFDKGEKREQLDRLVKSGLPDPSLIVETYRGYHAYWRLEVPLTDFALWSSLQVRLATLLETDPSIKDAPRVMRLAGSTYVKDGIAPFSCSIYSLEQSAIYSLESLENLLPELGGKIPREPVREPARDDIDYIDLLVNQVYPRLTLKQLFNWQGHNWTTDTATKLRGYCPGHQSKSGSSFHAEISSDGTPLCHCPSCDVSMNPIQYRHWIATGNSNPRGKDWIELAKVLFKEAQVIFPSSRVRAPEKKRREKEGAIFNNTVQEETNSTEQEDEKKILSEINQLVLRELYSDIPWICVGKELYKWQGNFYQLQDCVVELDRISDFLDNLVINDKTPFAKPSIVSESLAWVRLRFGKSPDRINPPGINCLNGIVRISWEKFNPKVELIPHSPEHYYTSEPTFSYDPKADPIDCNRLLEALDPSEREIFLRTAAASLDLPMVRKKHGRLVKALILVGDGSNGKDALREVMSLIHGDAMTATTLADFQTYDKGRKFPLARLRKSHCNWSSENALAGKIDSIQSLKSTITGEPISSEAKGQDEQEFNPKCILLFNCNEPPKIQGHQQAFLDRYGMLFFKKTFKIGANLEAGELEADPRFKYDPEFVKERVMPAFLNILLEQLSLLMSEGIDYTLVREAINQARSDSNHFYQCCIDIGLIAAKGEELSHKEVYDSVYKWYFDNGYVSEEKTKTESIKKVWIEEVDPHDKFVKTPQKLLEGLRSVFGNSLKIRQGKARERFIVGITLKKEETSGKSIEKPSHLVTLVTPTTLEDTPTENYRDSVVDKSLVTQEPVQVTLEQIIERLCKITSKEEYFALYQTFSEEETKTGIFDQAWKAVPEKVRVQIIAMCK